MVRLRHSLTLGLGLLIIAASAIALWHVRTVLGILFVAGFFAVGLNKPVAALMRRGWSRTRSVTVLVIVGNLLLCGILALIVPVLVKQGAELIAAVPSIVDSVLSRPMFKDFNNTTDFGHWLATRLTPQRVADVLGGVLGGAASVAGAVFAGLTAVMLGLFVLAGYDRIRAGAYRLVPASRRARFSALSDRILDNVSGYLVGSFTIAAIAGVSALLFMLIAGVPYALVLALVVAVFDLIPQIGATLGAIVVVAVALSQSLGLAIAAAIFFIVYQQTENWFVYPRMMNRAVKISNLGARRRVTEHSPFRHPRGVHRRARLRRRPATPARSRCAATG